jgi:Tfp pilus assembly PilM family ATPase
LAVVKAPARSRSRTLPLGIDVGLARVRVALAQRNDNGRTELTAVATREHQNDPAGALADALAELRTRERRCVFGLGEPSAHLRTVRFPTMRRGERERAARFEAAQFIDYPVAEAQVQVVPLGPDGEAAIGIVRKDAIDSLTTLARAAGLHVLAIDNTAFAVRRALPDVDAVLDVGLGGSRLYLFAGRLPIVRCLAPGGAAFTEAVAQALGTDEATAQRRKRSYGIAGCAESTRDLLVAGVANALVEWRADGRGDARTIALIGNGSRLEELPALLERATAVRVGPATFDGAISSTLPSDVLRAAAPDWCLALGLALWVTG